MKKNPPPEIVSLFETMAAAMGLNRSQWWINMPYVCDHCLDDDREAFPVNVPDRTGKVWGDLCNICYDVLGCEAEVGITKKTHQAVGLLG